MGDIKTYIRLLGSDHAIECAKPVGTSLWRRIEGALKKAIQKGWNTTRLLIELEERAARNGYKLCNCNSAVADGWEEIEIAFERPQGDYGYRFVFKVYKDRQGRIVRYELAPLIEIVAENERVLKKLLSWIEYIKTYSHNNI